MKLGICTIAKNEESFAPRWLKSTRDADYRLVLDTGSVDRTREILRSEGVQVIEARIEPWRFDRARELLRSQLPAEVPIWVTLDLDEIISPDWKEAIRTTWDPGVTTSLEHFYVAEWEGDGKSPARTVVSNRVFDPRVHRWQGAIHEYLVHLHGPQYERRRFCPNLEIHQFQDRTKDRSYYFELLKAEVAKYPEDPRSSIYLVNELFGRGLWTEAIREANRYLALPSSVYWKERSYAIRLIATCMQFKGEPLDLVIQMLFRAVAESPYEREPWSQLARVLATQGNWPNCFSACINGLRINDRSASYVIESIAWNGEIERLAAISAREIGIPEETYQRLLRQWVPGIVGRAISEAPLGSIAGPPSNPPNAPA